MTKPLLDIETLIARPAIDIDGRRYEILSPDELSVLDSRRFALWARKLEELQQGEAEAPELEELVDAIARKVMVGVPDEVFARLTGMHKIAVTEVFTALLLRSRMRVAGATGAAMGSPPIGEMFSPGFSASTAAGRGSGWRTRLSRWFGRTSG